MVDGIFLICKLQVKCNKIKSFSHGEYNNDNLNEKILKKNLRNEDIFGRNIKLKISLDDSYPEYIIQNKDKFLDWII